MSKKSKVTLDAEQKNTFRASALALMVSALLLGAGYFLLPSEVFGLTRARTVGERIAFALQADLLVFMWFAWCVRNASAGAFHNSADKAAAAILQNTLEQTVLAVGAHTILATVLRGPELILIPLLVVHFILGRLIFSLAYRQSSWRAFGMALTAAPTDASFVLAAALIMVGRAQ